MDHSHISQVVSIHWSSWDANEISCKLGEKYLRIFYTEIVCCPHSFGFVFEEDKKVIAYACGFYDYLAFNRFLAKKNRFSLLPLMLVRLMCGKLHVSDILNLYHDARKLRNARFPRFHLGALALDHKFKRTPEGRRAITQVMKAVVNELEQHGFPGCWGLCDEKNIAMRKHLTKFDFQEKDIIPFIGKRVILYEKEF